VLDACARLLALSDLGVDVGEGRALAERAITDGSATSAYDRWIRAQGGDPDELALPQAPIRRDVVADRGGYVARLGAIRAGVAALELGAGRRTKDDTIDHAVGVLCLKKRGDRVEQGEPLAEVHARSEEAAKRATRALLDAYLVDDEPPASQPLLIEVLD
jgi:thymidine phosphorylase